MSLEMLWAHVVIVAVVALLVGMRTHKVHRKTLSTIYSGIATIRDTRMAFENRKFKVDRRHSFDSGCGVVGHLLFEKYGVQAVHVQIPPKGKMPIHVHESTGEIYVVTNGDCVVKIGKLGDKTTELGCTRDLSSDAARVMQRTAHVDPGCWHEIVAGPDGCEMLNFSVPPQMLDWEDGH